MSRLRLRRIRASSREHRDLGQGRTTTYPSSITGTPKGWALYRHLDVHPKLDGDRCSECSAHRRELRAAGITFEDEP